MRGGGEGGRAKSSYLSTRPEKEKTSSIQKRTLGARGRERTPTPGLLFYKRLTVKVAGFRWAVTLQNSTTTPLTKKQG